MIKILKFTPKEAGALKGFADILIEAWGFEIRECGIFEASGKQWMNFPSRQYEKDGKKQYFAYNRFTEREKGDAFQAAFFKALEAFKRENQPSVNAGYKAPVQSDMFDPGECPF